MSGMLGKKIGMTRIFDESGNAVPVTVVKAGPCYITQLKTEETDGYSAVQVGFDEKKEKNTTQPILGHLNKAGAPPVRILKEFPLDVTEELKAGDVLNADYFEEGDVVKVTGLGKGRGFTGVIKRHNFGGGRGSHGQSSMQRAPGSVGQSSYPSKVFKGMKMAGRKGGNRVSIKGLQVMRVDAESNLLFIKGSVPGSRNSFIEIVKQ
ncbi:MAG: 50S ribosomal protein L3 [Calditrichota bacterium]